MIRIFIQGLKDGKHSVEIQAPVEEIPELSPEFFGNVSISGNFRKHQQRYTFVCKIICSVKLTCDLSLEEYEDTVEFQYRTSFIKDNSLYFDQKHRDIEEHEEIAIHEDDKYIDITNDLREELIIHLPMKRISPRYKTKSFEELYPEYTGNKKQLKNDKPIDDRWSALKKIKLNQSN